MIKNQIKYIENNLSYYIYEYCVNRNCLYSYSAGYCIKTSYFCTKKQIILLWRFSKAHLLIYGIVSKQKVTSTYPKYSEGHFNLPEVLRRSLQLVHDFRKMSGMGSASVRRTRQSSMQHNRISGIKISVFALSTKGRGFERGKQKTCKICIYWISDKHPALRCRSIHWFTLKSGCV